MEIGANAKMAASKELQCNTTAKIEGIWILRPEIEHVPTVTCNTHLYPPAHLVNIVVNSITCIFQSLLMLLAFAYENI